MGLELFKSDNDNSFNDIRVALNNITHTNKAHLLDCLKEKEWLQIENKSAQAKAIREGLFELRKQLELLSINLPDLNACKLAVDDKLLILAYSYPLNELSPRGKMSCPVSNYLVANGRDIVLSNGYIYFYDGLLEALRKPEPLVLQNISEYDIDYLREQSKRYSSSLLWNTLGCGPLISGVVFTLTYFGFMMIMLLSFFHFPLLLGVGAIIGIIAGISLAIGLAYCLVAGVQTYQQNTEEEKIVESHLLSFSEQEGAARTNDESSSWQSETEQQLGSATEIAPAL